MSNNDLKGGDKNDGKGRLQKIYLQVFDSTREIWRAVRNLDLLKKGLRQKVLIADHHRVLCHVRHVKN